jgi:electron transfer flavoprotein beta subunit
MNRWLNLVVLVKQVPEMDKVKFDVERGKINRSSAGTEVNPFDLNALETAVKIKEGFGGKVTTISMGPSQAESALRETIARGADRAILLTDLEFGGADTLATSYTLASAIKKLEGFDLIVCGEKTVDGDTGQVGPEVAQHLGIPHISYVSEIRDVSKEKIVVKNDMLEYYYILQSKLPALIAVTKDINVPRLPSLRDKLKARKAEVERWTAEDLADVADVSKFGLSGSPTWVSKISIPSEKGRKGIMFKGEPKEVAKKLIDALVKDRVVEM